MKTMRVVSVAGAVISMAGIFLGLTFLSRAQMQSISGSVALPDNQPDSVVRILADAQGLSPVAPEQIPQCGTFWIVSSNQMSPPYPFLPPQYDPATTPVYSLGPEGQFLVDASGGAVPEPTARQALLGINVAMLIQAQLDTVLNLITQVQTAEADRQTRAMAQAMGLDLPFPGDGGGTNTDEGGYANNYQVPLFTTNDLYLTFGGITNATAYLTIHPPWNVTNGIYDLFATTNLAPSAWQWILRCSPGQTNLTVTNLVSPAEFFILGLTNDSDGGGLTDAYEGLVTRTDPNNPNDDRLTPLVGVAVTDSVAVEQEATNTATFVLARLGGYLGQPLTAACALSGTATYSTDYTLAPASIVGTNVYVTLAAGQTNVTVTLTAVNDSQTEGSETVTLTLRTNAAWEVDGAHQSATAWILEEYTKIYTSNVDFNLGVLEGLEAVNNQLRFKTNLPPQFPFINVACSDRGTVARINTTNGMVMGEYLTAPADMVHAGDDSPSGPSPSRTTVDEYGNVWVANRDDMLTINGTDYGSITRIGLIVGGTHYRKETNGTYTLDPRGQYVKVGTTEYNTCLDRDGDGYIRTSQGLGDILPWSDERDGESGVDLQGGVSTAEDEAITEYTRVPCTGTRTIAVDKFNDIWVGGHEGNRTHLKVNGLTGSVVPHSAFDANAGGYGGVIDGLGNLWSSDGAGVVWLTPPTNLPPQTTDWQVLNPGVPPYGIAVDPLHPYIWQTAGSDVFRWHTNGTPVTNADGSLQMFYHGYDNAKGLVVAGDGHVWVGHAELSTNVGHLDTNGVWLGNVDLRVNGLLASYFANTNLSGAPVLTRLEGPVDFNWTNGWPVSPVPTNYFSVRWRGMLVPQMDGDHTFYVSANAGAAFRLILNDWTMIDNWTNPATNAVELSYTIGLFAGYDFDLRLEYRETTGAARIKLSWAEPGSSNKVVIPLSRLGQQGEGANGVAVDAAGKIWAACYNSSSAMRIDPSAGNIVVTNGVTNHLGAVDMAVDLGDGSVSDPHQPPYRTAAHPYNYSDMTGFNNHVVNPAMKPLKGYWTVIDDSGVVGEVWKYVTWNAALTNGCSIEIYVRASDDRAALADEMFVPVTNNAALTGPTVNGVRGRFFEVRLALTRDDASKQPVLNDLTLHGTSTSYNTDALLDDTWAYETQDAVFSPYLIGAEPMSYQWYVMYPWTNQWALLPGATNSELVITNVDSWVDGSLATVCVSNAAGETLWLGPAELFVAPLAIQIPGSSSSGPAARYPATINVFGQPTNLTSMKVTLADLSHQRSADLDILLVSPSGTNIMLMSHVGGTNGVSGATLVFWQGESLPPTSGPIPSVWTSRYSPSNYGNITNLPGAPGGPYSTSLYDLIGNNPNGVWKLYIYDDHQSGIGSLSGSWQLDFTF